MSRDGSITLDWGDGTYTFRLGIGELVSLEEARGAGARSILSRLQYGTWYVRDVGEVLRFGLIGGGLKPVEVTRLLRTFFEARPPMENLEAATAVLSAGLVGAPDEDVGESSAAEQETESQSRSPTDGTASRPSTVPEAA